MTEYWDYPVRNRTYSIVNKRHHWARFRDNPTTQRLLDFGETWWANRHFGDPRHFVDKRVLNEGYSPREIRDILEKQAKKGPGAITTDLPGMGVATLSEVLEVIDSSQFATLNSKSRDGLQALGYPVPGDEPDESAYREFTEHVKEIVPKYGLRPEVTKAIEGDIPNDVEPIDIAQVAFEMNVNDRFGFSFQDF